MSNETLFYICGIALAVSAVIFSFAGLKLKKFPGKAFPIVVLWFAILIGAATTYSVLNGKDEEKARAAELQEAGEEFEAESGAEPFEEEEAEEEAGGAEAEPAEGGEGIGSTLQLKADASALAFDTTSLEAEQGAVTIDLDNPAAIPHNVAIQKDGAELATTETISESKTSVTVELSPGDYTFLCTVPGHAEAGMEGTLTVR